MKNLPFRRILSMLTLLWAAGILGCTLADVQVDVVGERTSLENQVLGAYNALDREMLLLASVRGVDPRGQLRRPPEHTQEHENVMTAMRLMAFHEDDIRAFKQLRWVGENNEGLLTRFEIDRENPPPALADFAATYGESEFTTVVEQVNEARRKVMQRVIALNETLTESDLPEIRRIFGKKNAENALPGEKYQTESGEWKVREK